MPEVIVYLVDGRTLEQKRGLVKDITQAVIKNAGTTAEQVTISLVRDSKDGEGKRRRAVQRNARPLSASAKITQSCAEPRRFTPVNKIVSALHNVLAAVR